MAIFNNSDIQSDGAKTDSNTTIITAGAVIKGEITLSCNIYIDGEVEGQINSKKDVNIGKNGHVNGTVHAQRLVVQGYLEGSVDAGLVEIKAAGHIKGEILSTELVIESKGVFEGTSTIKESTKTKVVKTPPNK